MASLADFLGRSQTSLLGGVSKPQDNRLFEALVRGQEVQRIKKEKEDAEEGGLLGTIGGIGGTILGGTFGGPTGAAIGGAVGSGLGRTIGGNAPSGNEILNQVPGLIMGSLANKLAEDKFKTTTQVGLAGKGLTEVPAGTKGATQIDVPGSKPLFFKKGDASRDVSKVITVKGRKIGIDSAGNTVKDFGPDIPQKTIGKAAVGKHSLNQVKSVLDTFEDSKIGNIEFQKNILDTKLGFLASQQGRLIRADIYNMVDIILRDRTGAVINPDEFDKALEAWGFKAGDTLNTAKAKLRDLKMSFDLMDGTIDPNTEEGQIALKKSLELERAMTPFSSKSSSGGKVTAVGETFDGKIRLSDGSAISPDEAKSRGLI